MIALPLTADTPWSVTIAADARLTTTDYADDAIYALTTHDGPLGLHTSYGGRCQQMRYSLTWSSQDSAAPVQAAEEYTTSPILRDYGPGFALVEAQPLPELHARIAFVAHTSHITICHVEVHNHADAPLHLVLTAAVDLQRSAPAELGVEPPVALVLDDGIYGAYVTVGSPPAASVHLAFLWDTAAPFVADPLPGGTGWTIRRHHEIALAAGERRTLTLGLLIPPATDTVDTPFMTASLQAIARQVLATAWADVLAQHQAASANIPVIETGNAAWDAAIACAYRLAARCYLSGSGDTQRRPEVPRPGGRAPDIHRSGVGYPPLPYASFVFTRTPEHGYPPGGDPQQHSWQWNGQVATEAYVNVPEVAPFAPDLARAVLRNYLHIQQEDGFIDWKPGLAGQRAGWDCIPLLATLARLIYDYTGDLDFLHEVYDGLLRHLDRWFDPANDRNGDGYPEWTHTVQSAFDDNPSFVPWRTWAQGADISKANSPDLGAYLYREHRELVAIARLLPDQRRLALNADIVRLTHRADRLRAMVEALWSEAHATYLYADGDSHLTHSGEIIWETRGPGEWQHTHMAEGGNGKVRSFSPPITPPALARRIVVQIEGPEAPHVTVLLQGYDANDQPLHEVIERVDFGWWGGGDYVVSATSEGRFSNLTAIHVAGVGTNQRTRISFVDYTRQDQTQLLPLWAGIPEPARAEELVRRAITDPERFWRPYGMPNCSAQDPSYASDNVGGSGGVWMLWNTMIGEGLCDYGYYAEAWDLFSRIMAAEVRSLKTDHCFREAYDSDTGAGLGDRDYLWGTVPLHLLTRLHGVQILPTPDDPAVAAAVRLHPSDTLGRRIVISQRGVTVERVGRQATITWADGSRQEYTIGDAEMLVTG